MGELARLAARAREEGRLGIDTEFLPEGRYRPLLCLVQVAVGDEVAVWDPLQRDEDPAPMAAVLADPDIEIVLHAGRQDVAILRREWGTTFANVFDTQVAAGFAGHSAQAGYNGLLARRPAHPRRQDRLVHPLGRPPAHRRAARVRPGGRPAPDGARRRAAGPPARDGPARVGPGGVPAAVADATDERDPDEVWRRLPRASGLDPRARAVARELAAWRERTAAAEDRPVGAVVRDPTVRRARQRQPRDAKALGQIRGAGPDVLRRRARDILAAVERGRAAEPIVLEETERLGTESGDGPVIALAEALVRTRALEAGLAYELIAARADLAPVVVAARRGRPEPEVRTLQGWRRELVGEELLALLAGERTLAVGPGGRVAVEAPVDGAAPV